MDNPWATPSESTWSSNRWPATNGSAWHRDGSDAQWDPSESTTEDTTDERVNSPLPTLAVTGSDAGPMSDNQVPCPTSPSADSADPVPETADAIRHHTTLGTTVSDPTISPSDDGGTATWGAMPSSETSTKETQPPDQWETARQEKEKFNRAVPPELLDFLLRHCQQISQEIWPASETSDEGNWRSGFDDLSDIAVLLAQLAPPDSTLPPIGQFSETATAKAMNEALKLTRNLPASAASPLSRLLSSKGSLEWEKFIKAKQDIVPDTTPIGHVGWRVLEKEERLVATEDSKPKKATGSGLLSFWSRRVPTTQASPAETPREQSNSPARPSVESIKSVPHPSSSRAASPSNATPVVPPPVDSHSAAAAAPSAVSRFLNRFSRAKGNQHSALALSSDDIEFLSDIVPSASDPPDEDINGGALEVFAGASGSSPLPPKLPPPIPPPPKQPTMSGHPLALGLGTMNGVNGNGNAVVHAQSTNHTPNIPVLAPPLSPRPADLFSHAQSSPLSLKSLVTPSVPVGQLDVLVMQKPLQIPQASSRSHSPFTLSSPPKASPSLTIPPLLPPPPISPPQTPRPSTIPPVATSDHSSATQNNDASSHHYACDSDDEFSAFASFPPSSLAPFPASHSYPSKRSPSPPSPPPRRTYERTHYPSSSSTSCPGSHASGDQLYAAGSLFSSSLDSFDDFVSPPLTSLGENMEHTSSPPPLPMKPQPQQRQPPRIDTLPSRVYHAHTPSQTFASPTVRTSLLNGASSPTVSHAQHQRTQSLVSQAAARGGLLWPNSPDLNEPMAMAIPPPPSSSMSLMDKDTFDLLGDDNALGGGLEALPASLTMVGGISPSGISRSFRAAGSAGQGLEWEDQLQPSPPPLPSTSTPILSFSFSGTHGPLAAINTGSSQPAKPKQTSGLSAQDLSFFEGL